MVSRAYSVLLFEGGKTGEFRIVLRLSLCRRTTWDPYIYSDSARRSSRSTSVGDMGSGEDLC